MLGIGGVGKVTLRDVRGVCGRGIGSRYSTKFTRTLKSSSVITLQNREEWGRGGSDQGSRCWPELSAVSLTGEVALGWKQRSAPTCLSLSPPHPRPHTEATQRWRRQ